MSPETPVNTRTDYPLPPKMFAVDAGCPNRAAASAAAIAGGRGVGRDRAAPRSDAYTLSDGVSFWVAAAVVAHTLWTSAAPAMTYPLYAAQWGLTHTETTAIFAVYPIVVVAVLIGFGDISDYIGRRNTMLLGLAASLVGVFLFAVAPTVHWVFVGRAFMGLGVGLSASPAAAAMVEFGAGGQSKRASAINTAAQALGLAAATIVGGALIEYAPFPTRFNFAVLFAVLSALFVATWFLPRHRIANEAAGAWRPKLPTVPRDLRKVVATSALAVISGYALGAVMLSVGAQVARELIGSQNSLVNGAAIALFAIVAGIVAVPAKRLSSTSAMVLGGVATAAGMALLAWSATSRSLAVFLASAVAAGGGYSLLYTGGLGLINAGAPAHHRAGVLSAVYLAAYLLQGLIALLIGAAATAWGLKLAIDLGAAAIAVLSVGAIALAAATRGSASSTDASAAIAASEAK
jgi:hypothetical protein